MVAEQADLLIKAIDEASSTLEQIEDNTRQTAESLEDAGESGKQAGEDVSTGLDEGAESSINFKRNLALVTGAVVAATAVVESLQRELAEMNRVLEGVATMVGANSRYLRDMVVDIANVTRPVEELVYGFDALQRRGIENADAMGVLAIRYDELADALGREMPEVLRETSRLLGVFGEGIHQVTDYQDQLTYLFRRTPMDLQNMNAMLRRGGGAIRTFNLDLDEAIALIGVLARGFQDGETAARTLRLEAMRAEGDFNQFLRTVGVTEGQIESMKQEMEDATGITEELADQMWEKMTPLQHLEMLLDRIQLQYSDLFEALSLLLPLLSSVAMAVTMTVVSLHSLIEIFSTLNTLITTKFGITLLSLTGKFLGFATAIGLVLWSLEDLTSDVSQLNTDLRGLEHRLENAGDAVDYFLDDPDADDFLEIVQRIDEETDTARKRARELGLAMSEHGEGVGEASQHYNALQRAIQELKEEIEDEEELQFLEDIDVTAEEDLNKLRDLMSRVYGEAIEDVEREIEDADKGIITRHFEGVVDSILDDIPSMLERLSDRLSGGFENMLETLEDIFLDHDIQEMLDELDYEAEFGEEGLMGLAESLRVGRLELNELVNSTDNLIKGIEKTEQKTGEFYSTQDAGIDIINVYGDALTELATDFRVLEYSMEEVDKQYEEFIKEQGDSVKAGQFQIEVLKESRQQFEEYARAVSEQAADVAGTMSDNTEVVETLRDMYIDLIDLGLQPGQDEAEYFERTIKVLSGSIADVSNHGEELNNILDRLNETFHEIDIRDTQGWDEDFRATEEQARALENAIVDLSLLLHAEDISLMDKQQVREELSFLQQQRNALQVETTQVADIMEQLEDNLDRIDLEASILDVDELDVQQRKVSELRSALRDLLDVEDENISEQIEYITGSLDEFDLELTEAEQSFEDWEEKFPELQELQGEFGDRLDLTNDMMSATESTIMDLLPHYTDLGDEIHILLDILAEMEQAQGEEIFNRIMDSIEDIDTMEELGLIDEFAAMRQEAQQLENGIVELIEAEGDHKETIADLLIEYEDLRQQLHPVNQTLREHGDELEFISTMNQELGDSYDETTAEMRATQSAMEELLQYQAAGVTLTQEQKEELEKLINSFLELDEALEQERLNDRLVDMYESLEDIEEVGEVLEWDDVDDRQLRQINSLIRIMTEEEEKILTLHDGQQITLQELIDLREELADAVEDPDDLDDVNQRLVDMYENLEVIEEVGEVLGWEDVEDRQLREIENIIQRMVEEDTELIELEEGRLVTMAELLSIREDIKQQDEEIATGWGRIGSEITGMVPYLDDMIDRVSDLTEDIDIGEAIGSVMENIGDSMADVEIPGLSILGDAFGGLSSMFSSLLGPLGILLDIFMPVIQNMEVFQDLLDIAGNFLAILIEPLKPIIHLLTHLEPILNAIGMLLSQAIEPVFRALFPVIRWVAMGLNRLVWVLQHVRRGFFEVLLALAEGIDSLPLVSAGSAIAYFERKLEETSDSIDELNENYDDLKDMTYDNAKAKEEEKNATEDVNEELHHVPEGYKVALLRFQAMSAEAERGQETTTAAQTAQARETEQTEETGTAGRTGNGLIVILRKILQELKKLSTGDVNVDATIISDDPEEIWRRIKEIIDRERYEETGTIVETDSRYT